MGALNRLYRMAGVSELDSREQSDGAEAFAALAYQYRAELDARFMVLLWLLATAIPRFFEWMDKREEKKKSIAEHVKTSLDAPERVPLPERPSGTPTPAAA